MPRVRGKRFSSNTPPAVSKKTFEYDEPQPVEEDGKDKPKATTHTTSSTKSGKK